MTKFILALLLLSFKSFATEQSNIKQPLIDIKVGVELSEFEESASRIAHSVEEASKALQVMAERPNLDKQQQKNIADTFVKLQELSRTLQQTITLLPETISEATPPISIAVDNLFSNIQLTIILVLVAIVLILIIALIALFYWVIKPSRLILLNTTTKLDNMATSLQTTANIVEKSSDQQLRILNTLQQ